MTRPARVLAILILFVGGYNFALPVAAEGAGIPLVFTPIQVAHGVFIRDALLMLYLAVSIVVGSMGKIRLRHDEKRFALLITALGFAGILSAVVNLASLYDIGEALRLCLFAAYFCMVVHWASTLGTARVLRTFLLGIAVGGAINLFYTFKIQFMTIGILPFLLGQNGPGGNLGLAVSLGAWLMLLQRRRADALVAVVVSLLGVFAASISYSKLAILMALAGLVSWTAVIVTSSAARQSRRLGLALLGLVLTVYLGVSTTSVGQGYLESVRGFTDNKFGVLDIYNPDLGARYMYFWSVLEILEQHPIVGVAYSGFYDAVTSTGTYQDGSIGVEIAGPKGQGLANPHNAFLYYISANGMIGLVLAAMLFVLFLRVLHGSLVPYGRGGLIVWLGLALAYVVNAMTLPTLYNTEVLFLPAALAFSELRHRIKPAAVGSGRVSLSRAAPPAYRDRARQPVRVSDRGRGVR